MVIMLFAMWMAYNVPEVLGARMQYFDVNNGRVKYQWISASGSVKREFVEDTEFTRLLREQGFKEQSAMWRPMVGHALGLRRLSDYELRGGCPPLSTAARHFCLALRFRTIGGEALSQEIVEFMAFLRRATRSDIRAYMRRTSEAIRDNVDN